MLACLDAMKSDCKKEINFEKFKRSTEIMCGKKSMDVLDRHAACIGSMNLPKITAHCRHTLLTGAMMAGGDIDKTCQVEKDYISCQRMALAPHCGDEVARYMADGQAHTFQIGIEANGEDCDVTGGQKRVGCSAVAFVGATLILPALRLLG